MMGHSMHTIFLAAIAAFATARVTRLITRDRILAAPRRAALRVLPEESLFAYLLVCDWCVSVYVGTAMAAGGAYTGVWPWSWVAWLALAFSHVTGFMASKEGDE